MNFRRQRRETLEISITPMIDVVFLLLIFFMVSTTFNKETELKIQLPEAQGENQNQPATVEISIDAQGLYYVNQHQVINQNIDTLKKAIREALGDSVDPPVVIAADARTPHQSVISVLDAAKQLGILSITFATKTSPDSLN